MAIRPGQMPSAPPLEVETRRLLLGLLTRHTPGMAAANIVVAVIFSLMLWRENSTLRIGYWLTLPASINLARWAWNARLRRNLPSLGTESLLRAEIISAAIIALNGAAWGALAWIAYNGDQVDQDFFTLAVVVGMTGGAVTPLSTLRYAFPLFAAMALLPFLAKSLWIGGNIYLAGGGILTAYLILLFGHGRATHHTLRHAFHLQLEKKPLAAYA